MQGTKTVRRPVKGGTRDYAYDYSTLHVVLPNVWRERLKEKAGAAGLTQSEFARKIIHRALYA